MDIKQKRRVVHALMHKLGVLPNKRDILAAFDAESTLELSNVQIDDLIDRLNDGLRNRYITSPEERQWRSNVLLMLNKCGVYADQGDWSRVNSFLLNKKIAGKLLYEMSVTEMKELYRKLRSIAAKKQREAENRLYNNLTMN